MSSPATAPPKRSTRQASPSLPHRRHDLVIRALGGGNHVIKDPATGAYFQVGEQELFLLMQCDRRHSAEDVLRAFEQTFHEPLSHEELQEFLQIVRERHLVQEPPAVDQSPGRTSSPPSSRSSSTPETKTPADSHRPQVRVAPKPAVPPRLNYTNALYFRYRLLDPDRALSRLEPWLRWIWTPEFLIISSLCFLGTGLLVWANRVAFYAAIPPDVRWETCVATWLTLVAVTMCHEFAHGLTCKHFGGDVREVGVLVMFFTPCLYCNVSDAWMLPDRWKRIWITLAGGWCDLCIWSVSTMIWRVTLPETFVNHLAWIISSICGARTLINFSPFMKMDGYYLLTDFFGVSNLRKISWDRWMETVRHLLWGAPAPAAVRYGTWLTAYGFVCWFFAIGFLGWMLSQLGSVVTAGQGWVGKGVMIGLGVTVVPLLFKGFIKGEVKNMLQTRSRRTVAWVAILVGSGLAATLIGVEDRAGGTFHVRPGTRQELRAEVPAFLKEVFVSEGDQVAAGACIARLEIPDLASQIVQKKAALEEATAHLQRLERGARPEEIHEQKLRVARAHAWRDRAQQDLLRVQQSLKEELARFDHQISQYQTELDYARSSLVQSERLFHKGVLAGEQLRAEKKKVQVAELQWQQVVAQKRTRESSGTLEHESELARRDKEVADAVAVLALLQAGARPEEIAAEQAKCRRLQEELAFFQSQESKLLVYSPVPGIVTTSRPREKVGLYLEKGTVICTIENIARLEAELAVPEDEAQGVQVGQVVELKARAFPMKTFQGKVDRIAPIVAANPADRQGNIHVYCEVNNSDRQLQSGMSGFGRVYLGERSLAGISSRRIMRYFRTEFWW